MSTPSGRRALVRAAGLTGPSPTIVVVHGYTGTPTGIETVAELTDAANARGIAVVYPQGTPTEQGGFGWNTGASVFATEFGDDVTALGELMDAAAATGCVDPSRLTLVGESNGGGMALVAACSAPLAGRFTRVVLVNAAVGEGVLARCSGTDIAVPVSVVAGALDETVPIDGSDELLPVEDWFAAAGSVVGGCTTIEAAPGFDAVVSRALGMGCSACTELLVVADGTHTWPGTSRGNSGLAPGSFALNDLLLDNALTSTTGCLTGLP